MTTSIRTKTAIVAFFHEFEIICIMSAIALLADFIWLMHDVFANGLNFTYMAVGAGLLTGLIGTTYVLYKHHVRLCKEILHTSLISKSKIAKLKHKHKV